jgi:hypothetical protein
VIFSYAPETVSQFDTKEGNMTNEHQQNDNKRWPKSIDEAVQMLLARLSEEDKETIKNTHPYDLAKYHHGLGTYIRNEFGLWKDSPLVPKNPYTGQRVLHPDDVSGIILRALHKALNPGKEPSDFGKSSFERMIEEIKNDKTSQ